MITIPKQHYIGLKRQYNNETPLAFLTPYDDHNSKTFEKRQSTVDRWARDTRREYDSTTKKYNDLLPLDPRIVDNELFEGYKIAEEVRRTYWGGGNVVWRMVDPRGWEFEISSSNLARILDCATISNGVIQGKCIIGRDKAQNVLLPENSEPYQQAVVNTSRADKKVSIKDVTPGDIVVLKDGRQGMYLGVYSVAHATYKIEDALGSSYYNRTQYVTRNFADVKKRHLFMEKVTKELKDKLSLYDVSEGSYTYTAIADPRISVILNKAKMPLDVKKTAEDVTKMLQGKEKNRYDNLTDAYFVTADKIKTIAIKEIPSSFEELKATGKHGRRPFFLIRLSGSDVPLSIAQRDYGLHDDPVYYVHTISDGIKDGKAQYIYGAGTIDETSATDGVWSKVAAEYDGKQFRIRTY